MAGDTELLVAIVALVISVLAFVIAILQALQQYFTTATGFSSCGEAVIGKWAQFARRQMLWSEFRFEVQFAVPVIFVAPPSNTRGPLGRDEDRKIIQLDGSAGNHEYIPTQLELDSQNEQKGRQLVHTADNEKATWCELLTTIYTMEEASRKWQEKISNQRHKKSGPPQGSLSTDVESDESKSDALTLKDSSLVVCMQRKQRTWDSMPEGIKKPYATTTISHLVEIAAMLGIHWKQFDLNNDRYRAQGNGLVLYGSYVDHLGITFTFQKQGKSFFERDRVIPNNDVKRFCFGMAPTIFQRENASKAADEPPDIGTLQMGSLEEIAQTLQLFGCHINAVNTFRANSKDARHSHVFPVPFEVLGMVGEMIYIPNTVFRMLPNPTVFRWDPTTFSLPAMMDCFHSQLEDLAKEYFVSKSQQILRLLNWLRNRRVPLVRTSTLRLDAIKEDGNDASLFDELDCLRKGIALCDGYLKKRASMMLKVLRVHIQEVLQVLNEGDAEATPSSPRTETGLATMHDIDSAFYKDREDLLIRLYFESIRQNVGRIVCEQDQDNQKRRNSQAVTGSYGAVGSPASITLCEANEVWCTLVLRMLCWLQLHNFHKMDVHVTKTDAYASRIPAYIV